MTILPLVDRELRVRARNSACYWTRFGAALVGFLICSYSMIVYGFPASDAQKGAMAFNGLVAAAFILCCFSGFLTVDKISRERREGTLGLLFLTRVRVVDVLVGNFGAAGIASLCALAAFVPVLVMPVLAGGVTGGEAARKVLALFGTMILSLAVGLWASASARGWVESARAAMFLLVLFIVGPLVLSLPGPLKALTAADDLGYHAAPGPYWISIAVILGTSLLLIVWATLRLNRAWRNDDETSAKFARSNAAGEESAGFQLGPFQFKRHQAEPLADGQPPIDWLLRRQRGMAFVIWGVIVLWLFFICGQYFLPRGGIIYSYQAMSWAYSLLESSAIAWIASRYFIEARRTGELELLMTTPEGARSIVRSHWQWLKQKFWWPMTAVVAMWGIIEINSFIQFRTPGFLSRVFILNLAFFAVNIVLGLVALLWVGMWFGWCKRSQSSAIIWTVLVTKGFPYVFPTLGAMIVDTFAPPRAGGYPVWYTSLIPNFLFYLFVIWWARRRFGVVLLSKPAKREPFRLAGLLYRVEN